MRAVRFDRYGPPDVLRVVELPDPQPRAGEIVIKVGAASLNPIDWKIRAGHIRFIPLFARPPRTVGIDLAGEVIALGGGTGSRFVGERVFGMLSPFGRDGSCAEHVVVGAHRVVPIPAEVTFEQAATLPVAGGEALQALTDEAHLREGQRALIVGAAGGVGHFAVQVAKHAGAHVVASCGPDNTEFVRSIGADEVIDYTREDVLQSGSKFDVVFDAAGALDWHRASRVLVRDGLYLGTGGDAASAMMTGIGTALAPLVSGTRSRNVVLRGDPPVLRRLGELVASRALHPHIERRVSLEGVADAQRGMESGHGRGKIVVLPYAASP
jgi:NADPH:quinone reductase-like Zn-dependent oxidoreductase